MDFVDSGNGLLTSHTAQLPEGSFSAFLARIYGTNGGGGTLLTTDLGRARLVLNGEDLINTDQDILHTLNNFLFGFPEETSAVGAAFAFTFLIPCGLPKDPNNILITKNDQAHIGFDFSLAAAAVAPTVATWEIYGIRKYGTQSHTLRLHQMSENYTAATVDRWDIPVRNVKGLLIKAGTPANMSRIEVFVDGKVRYNTTWAAAVAYSNLIHNVEAAEADLYIPFALSNTMQEVMSDEIEVQVQTTGATTLDIYSLFYNFTPQKFQESSLYVGADVRRTIERKSATGQTDDVKIQRIVRQPVVKPPAGVN